MYYWRYRRVIGVGLDRTAMLVENVTTTGSQGGKRNGGDLASLSLGNSHEAKRSYEDIDRDGIDADLVLDRLRPNSAKANTDPRYPEGRDDHGRDGPNGR